MFDLARARRLVRRLEEDIKTFIRRPPQASPENPAVKNPQRLDLA